jgi:hypothetical protein
VSPATNPITGFDMFSRIQAEASASCGPPISPIISTASVSGSVSNRARWSRKDEPLIGSPPMPTEVEIPSPSSLS